MIDFKFSCPIVGERGNIESGTGLPEGSGVDR
jgi:hypothetical protein